MPQRLVNKSNTTGDIRGARTEFTSVIVGTNYSIFSFMCFTVAFLSQLAIALYAFLIFPASADIFSDLHSFLCRYAGNLKEALLTQIHVFMRLLFLFFLSTLRYNNSTQLHD